MGTIASLDLGHYEAARAAALSGVPERTVYHWAKTGLIVPSISASRQKLWSYRDLLTLRLVAWLRTAKEDHETGEIEVAASKLRDVAAMLDRAADELWRVDDEGREVPSVGVTRDGLIVLLDDPAMTAHGQGILPDVLDLFAPFGTGVDLRRPRPHLRIVPGKVSGEPHLSGSRLMTQAVASAAARGLSMKLVAKLYPHEDPVALAEAIDLETSLAVA